MINGFTSYKWMGKEEGSLKMATASYVLLIGVGNSERRTSTGGLLIRFMPQPDLPWLL